MQVQTEVAAKAADPWKSKTNPLAVAGRHQANGKAKLLAAASARVSASAVRVHAKAFPDLKSRELSSRVGHNHFMASTGKVSRDSPPPSMLEHAKTTAHAHVFLHAYYHRLGNAERAWHHLAHAVVSSASVARHLAGAKKK